ncbi:50S ribosomal protein L1 [Streptococcus pneumoniae]|nr:50S ribosomal protein L1 [Streptococcus pneumoniae]
MVKSLTVLTVQVTFKQFIGKVSFEAEKLVENFKAFNETIQKAKPATAKGTYVTNLTITTTQGVGIKVDVNSL